MNPDNAHNIDCFRMFAAAGVSPSRSYLHLFTVCDIGTPEMTITFETFQFTGGMLYCISAQGILYSFS
jgi:hypothetical protein